MANAWVNVKGTISGVAAEDSVDRIEIVWKTGAETEADAQTAGRSITWTAPGNNTEIAAFQTGGGQNITAGNLIAETVYTPTIRIRKLMSDASTVTGPWVESTPFYFNFAGVLTVADRTMTGTLANPTLTGLALAIGTLTVADRSLVATLAAPTLTGIEPVNRLGNSGFESALAGSLGYDNWFAVKNHASGAAERLSSATMTGSYVGHLKTGGLSGGSAQLQQKITGDNVRASSLLSLRIRPILNAASSTCYLNVIAYDSGDVAISKTANGENYLRIFGDQDLGSAGDETSVIISSPSMDTNYDRSFDLLTWLSTRYEAGKSAADISYVTFQLSVYTSYVAAGLSEAYFDGVTLI